MVLPAPKFTRQADDIAGFKDLAQADADTAGLVSAAADEFKSICIQNGHAYIVTIYKEMAGDFFGDIT